MCGIYTGYIDESEELKTIYTAAGRAYPNTDFAVGEIFPTNTVPLLTGVTGQLRPFAAVWGFPSYRGKGVIINARSETVCDKPIFADSFRRRRCIVPTTGYFEWTHDSEKVKYRFNRPDSKILYLGALWQRFNGEVRFVILTTEANRSTSDVHHRMPIILDEAALDDWSGDLSYAAAYIAGAMPTLVRCVGGRR